MFVRVIGKCASEWPLPGWGLGEGNEKLGVVNPRWMVASSWMLGKFRFQGFIFEIQSKLVWENLGYSTGA